MKRVIFFFTILVLSICSRALENNLKVSYSIPFKSTEISAENFELRNVETAFDLAINLSYFHYKSNGFSSEYLILPIILINGNPIDEPTLKDVSFSDIFEYQFKSGFETEAIYGTRVKYGLLNIVLKKGQ